MACAEAQANSVVKTKAELIAQPGFDLLGS
jgi:hypothetical protein